MPYHVYIMASTSKVLYVGVTSDLTLRVYRHKHGVDRGSFSARYRTRRLVYHEVTEDVSVAIEREKQLKGWRRARKVALIVRDNPGWRDLARNWFRE